MQPFADFVRSGNLAVDPETYELENDAIARDGRLDAALAERAPWEGRDLVDVGCGNAYWLPALLRIEFPGEVVDDLVAARPPSGELTYGVALFTVRVPAL